MEDRSRPSQAMECIIEDGIALAAIDGQRLVAAYLVARVPDAVIARVLKRFPDNNNYQARVSSLAGQIAHRFSYTTTVASDAGRVKFFGQISCN